MKQEEKAIRYDKALEIAKTLYCADDVNCMDLETIFPELKESEDERIRKELLSFCQNRADNYLNDPKYANIGKWIAWLEKQKEPELSEDLGEYIAKLSKQFPEVSFAKLSRIVVRVNNWLEKQGEPTDINPSEFDLRLNKLLEQFETLPKEELASSLSFYLNAVQNDGTYREEKQDEQKPFDYENAAIVQKDFAQKAEPKFHEGEWITNGDYTWKIVEVKPLDYILQSQDGNIVDDTIAHVDEQFHSFTIEDAKDGDVLACNEEILLFKSYSVQGRISLYCWYNWQTNNFHSKEVDDALLTTRNKICPATKEQCDTLFSKMKEAGYEWNEKAHEIKKIAESELTEFEDAVKDMMDDYRDAIDDNPPTTEEVKERAAYMLSLIPHKPAWSEEDESILQGIINAIKEVRCQSLLSEIEIYDDYIDWLKSIKQRIGG